MPIPKPHSGENEKDFISRCMGDDVMVEEYPDEEQRSAVCYRSWQDSKQSASSPRETFVSDNVELTAFRDTKADRPLKLEGYATLYNVTQELWPGHSVTLAPNIFKKSLEGGADVRALFNHNPDKVLGRNTAEPPTLTLRETQRGLKVTIWPPDTPLGNEIVTLVERGDLSQMSIGFISNEADEEIVRHGTRELERIIHVGDLDDISVVTYPAFPDTTVAVKRFEAFTGKRIVVPAKPKVESQDLETISILAQIDEHVSHERQREARMKQ